MSTAAYSPRPAAVLADAIPGTWARDIALVVAGALLTVVGAQIAIHVPPSPVPVTGQTLAVVIAGAALGWKRGAASPLLYVLLGLFLPVSSDGASGPDVIWGATGGYLIGFIIAAGLIGRMAELGADRKPHLAFLAFCAAQLVIFGIGVPVAEGRHRLDLGVGDPPRLRDLHRRRHHQGARGRGRHPGSLARCEEAGELVKRGQSLHRGSDLPSAQ